MSANRNKKRGILGFTMAEMVMVVGIIAVLVAVATPAMFSLRQDLRMRELDEHAQQIYDAVQNRLSAIKASGPAFNKDNPGDENTLYGAMTKAGVPRVTQKPSDYDDSNTLRPWDDEVELYQLSYDDEAGKQVIRDYLFKNQESQISSGLLSGSFIIELSPKTGEVYAVYYWEESDAKAPGGGAVTYDAISGLRSQSDRKPYNLGYYGGGTLGKFKPEENPYAGSFADLTADVVNSEELYVRLKSADIGKLANVDDLSNSFRIELFVSGTSIKDGAWGNKETWFKMYAPNPSGDAEQLSVSPTDNEVDIVLDSMRTDKNWHFADIVKNILPGADLSISVRVFCNRGQENWNTVPIADFPMETNSLYGNGSTVADGDKRVAKVSANRHLRNLDLDGVFAASGIGDRNNYAWSFERYNGVEIENDIDFDGNTWKANPECVSIQSRIERSGNGYNPLTVFTPIVASRQMAAGIDNILDGKNHALKNYNISSKDASGNFGESTGLFKEVTFAVNDLNFEDPRVEGGNNTGVLVGKQTNGSIANCHVYATGTKENIGVTATGDNVGGLAGYLKIMNLENCSAAVDVFGHGYVGGLFGADRPNDTYVSVNNCRVGYKHNDPGQPSLVTVRGSGDYVGGITGAKNAPTTDSHVLANVSGVSHVGGITGVAEGNEVISNCTVDFVNNDTVSSVYGTDQYVGGITGELKAGSVVDCTAVANVTGEKGYVGGIAGASNAPITNSYVGTTDLETNVTVEGRGLAERIRAVDYSYVGGISGRQKSDIKSCLAIANVQAEYDCVGGIAGLSEGYTESCQSGYADQDTRRPITVFGKGSQVGGITGLQNVYMTGCIAIANVHADKKYAGGIAGKSVESIVNCHTGSTEYDTGITVESFEGYVGGITGEQNAPHNPRFKITDCVSVANIHSTGEFAGGLAGWADGDVTNCYVFGSKNNDDGYPNLLEIVSNHDKVGGLIGYYTTGYVTKSFAATRVTYDVKNASSRTRGTHYGGLIGHTHDAKISYCYANGAVRGRLYVGGFVGFRCECDDWQDCFSMSSVYGDNTVGGFLGHNEAGSHDTVRCVGYGKVQPWGISTVYYSSISGFSGDGPVMADGYGTFYMWARTYNDNYSTVGRDKNIRKYYDDAVRQSLANSQNIVLSDQDVHPFSPTCYGGSLDDDIYTTRFPFGPIAWYEGSTPNALPFYGFWPQLVY